jgi:hypothetical protein
VDPRAKLQVAGKVGWNDTALRCLAGGWDTCDCDRGRGPKGRQMMLVKRVRLTVKII